MRPSGSAVTGAASFAATMRTDIAASAAPSPASWRDLPRPAVHPALEQQAVGRDHALFEAGQQGLGVSIAAGAGRDEDLPRPLEQRRHVSELSAWSVASGLPK